MKSKEQVLKYISQCRFPDEDWECVLDFCKKQYGGGKAHRAISPISDSTYVQFEKWLTNDIAAVGDIVRYGHTIGIVGASTPDCTRLACYFNLNGELIEQSLDIVPSKMFQAFQTDKDKVAIALRKNGVRFSISLAALVAIYKPSCGDIVRIVVGEKASVGIVRSVDSEHIYMYVYVDKKDIQRDIQIKTQDVMIAKSTKTDLRKLQVALNKAGYEWSFANKALVKVNIERVADGERYWYVTERFTVCSDVDRYNKRQHEERYKVGNYFSSYQAAFLFCQKVLELRKKVNG